MSLLSLSYALSDRGVLSLLQQVAGKIIISSAEEERTTGVAGTRRECQHIIRHSTIVIYKTFKPYHKLRYSAWSWLWRLLNRGINDRDWVILISNLKEIEQQVASKTGSLIYECDQAKSKKGLS